MKTKTRLSSLGLVAFSLFLIFMVSTSLAVTVQESSSTGPYAYITNYGSNTVTVIDTVNNNAVATVNVGGEPRGVAVTPDEKKYMWRIVAMRVYL
jgi:YVTN family beta-propeller protein